MEVFMSEIAGLDHVSLGMRRPNGEYERPIPGRRLFWTKPGMTCAYVVRYISCHGGRQESFRIVVELSLNSLLFF